MLALSLTYDGDPRDWIAAVFRTSEGLRHMVAALGSTSGTAVQLEGGIHDLLGSARRLFQADYAEIL